VLAVAAATRSPARAPQSAVPVLANAGRLAFPALASRHTAASWSPPHGQATAGRLARAVPLGPRRLASATPRTAGTRRSDPGGPMGWAAPVGCADQFVRPNHHRPFLMRWAPRLVPDGWRQIRRWVSLDGPTTESRMLLLCFD